LINGDAEAGDLAGWTLNAGDSRFRAATKGDIGQKPHAGQWMFTSVYDPGTGASMSQSGTSGLTAKALRLSGWFMHEKSYADYGRASIRIYDPSNHLLASKTTGNLDAGQDWIWAPFELTIDVHEGAYRWEVEMTATKGPGGGYPDVYFDALVFASIGYEAWRTTKFTTAELADPAISGDEADPDRDGLCNLLECAFGLEPKTADIAGKLPYTDTAGGPLTFTYRQSKAAGDLIFTPQSATDLASKSWSPNDFTETARDDRGDHWLVTFRHQTPVSATPARFMRLTVKR
jgi:hypothetical protein